MRRKSHNDRVRDSAEARAMLESLSDEELELFRIGMQVHYGAAKGIQFRMNEQAGQRVRVHPAVFRAEMIRLGYAEKADFE